MIHRRHHRWASIWAHYPQLVHECVRCGLRRRVVEIGRRWPTQVGGPIIHVRYLQQYRKKGASDWTRGHDGSLLFDHGGVPPCKPVVKEK